MTKNSIAIAGIHTGVGKTIASAVIAEALGADYWKPVQAGLEECDTDRVRQLLTDGHMRVHPEAVRLLRPLSPHAAAEAEGIAIDFTRFHWPQTGKPLVVETAGGLLSPMSATTTMADFIAYYHLPVVLVLQHYLGSINHTLLSLEVLKSRKIPLLGVVISGPENESSESFIAGYGAITEFAHIPYLAVVDQPAVSQCAAQIRERARKYL